MSTILDKAHNEEYNKQNDVVFTSVKEFVETLAWNFDNTADYDELADLEITDFWGLLVYVYNFTPAEIVILKNELAKD